MKCSCLNKVKQQIEYYSLKVVTEDLEQLGYMFSWQKLDAQSFLLRQRRLRVWGVADVMNDSSQESFRERMRKTIDSMSGNDLLEFEKCFDITLPKQRLTNELQRKKLSQSLAKARLRCGDSGEEPNVFMDVSTGKDRDAESAENVSTCVRPSHQVYNSILGRTLCAKELWHCQGLFESAFPHVQAVRELMKNHAQAQGLAGEKGF